MRVQELMTTDVVRCSPDTDGGKLAQMFWDRDCGAVPVVDEESRVLGIVTDRDLAIALGTRDRRASEVRVADLMPSGEVVTIRSDADVHDALDLMRDRQVGRLPVVDGERRLVGILTLGRVARACPRNAVSAERITRTLGTSRGRTERERPATGLDAISRRAG